MSVLAALLLADGRFPSGGHAHSGGLEEAATSARVHDLDSLRAFVEGRLATTGRVSAALAAVACAGQWSVVDLDAEADARMASPAVRAASRRQGRQLLRSAAHAWPVVAVERPTMRWRWDWFRPRPGWRRWTRPGGRHTTR